MPTTPTEKVVPATPTPVDPPHFQLEAEAGRATAAQVTAPDLHAEVAAGQRAPRRIIIPLKGRPKKRRSGPKNSN